MYIFSLKILIETLLFDHLHVPRATRGSKKTTTCDILEISSYEIV